LPRKIFEKANAGRNIVWRIGSHEELVVAEDILIDIVDGAEFVLTGFGEYFRLKFPEFFEGGFKEGLRAVRVEEARQVAVAEVGEACEDAAGALAKGVDFTLGFEVLG